MVPSSERGCVDRICMKLIDTSLDKFYQKVMEKNMKIPEDILEETVSIVWALE
jgi:mitogen-activated protein kinase kinase 3